MTVESFSQYQQWIAQLLKDLSPINAFRFAVWCVLRFPIEFGENVYDGLTDEEKANFLYICNELASHAAKHKILLADDAGQMIKILEDFGPHDEVEAIEVLPESNEMQSAVWNTLRYCQTNDLTCVCNVSESLINLFDYYVETKDKPYLVENMFTSPSLKRELERQEEYVASLSNAVA